MDSFLHSWMLVCMKNTEKTQNRFLLTLLILTFLESHTVNFHWQRGQVAISHLVFMNYIYACFSLEFCLWCFVFVCIFKVYVFAFNFCKQASLRITMLWVPWLNINIPFTPRSDKHVTSPYSVYMLSSEQVVRLLKLIRYKILSWLNTKFS